MCRRLLLLHLGRTAARQHTDGRQRINAEHTPANQGQHDRADTNAAPPNREAAATTATISTAVFYVV